MSDHGNDKKAPPSKEDDHRKKAPDKSLLDISKTTSKNDNSNSNSNNNRFSPQQQRKRRRSDENNNKKKKHGQHWETAYSNVNFQPIPSTGRPGTPHRQFRDSYHVTIRPEANNTDPSSDSRPSNANDTTAPPPVSQTQVLHQHANGLVIVTAGQVLQQLGQASCFKPEVDGATSTPTTTTTGPRTEIQIQRIEFLRNVAPVADQSANQKRKHQSQLLKRGQTQQQQHKDDGVVRPQDVLAHIHVQETCSNSNSSSQRTHIIPVYAGVWGTLLEINPQLLPASSSAGAERNDDDNKNKNNNHNKEGPSTENDDSTVNDDSFTNSEVHTLLHNDPLLDGYISVVLPTGKFPGPSVEEPKASGQPQPDDSPTFKKEEESDNAPQQ